MKEMSGRDPDTMETCLRTAKAMRMWEKVLTSTLVSLFIQAPEVAKENICYVYCNVIYSAKLQK